MKPQKSSKATKLVSTQIQNKIYKHQTQIFEEIADQISPLLKKIKNKKKARKARTCWYRILSSDLSIPYYF